MSEHELVMALDSAGIRSNPAARAKLARDLHERGVSRVDIAMGFAFLTEKREHPPARASSILASLLANASAWVPFVAEVQAADQAERFSGTKRDHDVGKGLRVSPTQQRLMEYQAAGLSREEAALVEKGGYVHARIVGDFVRPADVAQEVGVDPFEVVHLACHWADVFGAGRAALRRQLTKMVRLKKAAESLLEELEHAPQRSLPGEAPVPDMSGWRQRATPSPKPRPITPSLGDPGAAAEIAAKRRAARALVKEPV